MMAKAIAPKEMPSLPEGATAWARSTRRAGGMFHAHVIGFSSCGKMRFDRFKSVAPNGLHDMQYWGVCPSCYKLAQAASSNSEGTDG
jgi:hypothetical protein